MCTKSNLSLLNGSAELFMYGKAENPVYSVRVSMLQHLPVLWGSEIELVNCKSRPSTLRNGDIIGW